MEYVSSAFGRSHIFALDTNALSVMLGVQDFEPITGVDESRRQAFDDLVIPSEAKALLKAVISKRVASSAIVVFLYGPPGCGKASC